MGEGIGLLCLLFLFLFSLFIPRGRWDGLINCSGKFFLFVFFMCLTGLVFIFYFFVSGVFYFYFCKAVSSVYLSFLFIYLSFCIPFVRQLRLVHCGSTVHRPRLQALRTSRLHGRFVCL